MADNLEFINENESKRLLSIATDVKNLRDLSKVITKFIKESKKEVVLFIDEVDKSSNNQLFLSFLGMLRNKYLLRQQGKDRTFSSVILAGVYDIKNLKLKFRNDDEKKYNSPWNIAVNFDIDMSFNSLEISSMLREYSSDKNVNMDIEYISELLYEYTSGYPFLVSRICQIIDEKLKISNRVFEQRLYNYYSSKLENKVDMSSYNFKDNFITSTGLDFKKIPLRFQQFIKEQYSTIDSKFI